MSLAKLLKEEGKRSKSASASPNMTPGLDGTSGVGSGAGQGAKVEKRKPEDEAGEEDLSKRAKLEDGIEPNAAAEVQTQAQNLGDTIAPQLDDDITATQPVVNHGEPATQAIPAQPESTLTDSTAAPPISESLDQDQPMDISTEVDPAVNDTHVITDAVVESEPVQAGITTPSAIVPKPLEVPESQPMEVPIPVAELVDDNVVV